MVRNFLWPFFLSALIMGLTGVLVKTLGPVTFVVVFAASAAGAISAGLNIRVREFLERNIWLCATLGFVAAVTALVWSDQVRAWWPAAAAIFMWTSCLTRILQTALRSAPWLMATTLGTAVGPLFAQFKGPVHDPAAPFAGLRIADFIWQPDVAQEASLFPTLFLGLALLLALLHLSLVNRRAGPLLAGGFLTGLGYSGLLVTALNWLPSGWTLPAFGLAAFLGVSKVLNRPNELMAPLLTSILIRAVIASIVGFYLIQQMDVAIDTRFHVPAVLIASLPVFWSAQAWASQLLLMKPGGERAVAQFLGVYFLGMSLGGITVTVASWFLGPMPAVAVAGGFYLVAALVFSEERFWPFAKTLLSQPG